MEAGGQTLIRGATGREKGMFYYYYYYQHIQEMETLEWRCIK